MQRWKRKRGDYLVKYARITDGEMLHLLTGNSAFGDDALDEAIFDALKRIKTSAGKALMWTAGASAFGVLSHFHVLLSASSSGLAVSPIIFNHAALLALAISTACYCFLFCKQSCLQSWFSYKLKAGTPAQKARCLLRFPEAYWHFSFLPATIGYPPHIVPRGRPWLQLIHLLLMLVALVIFVLGSIMLWLVLAADVWASTGTTPLVSTLTIVLAAAITLLGWLSPFYYDVPRTYFHHGLMALLLKRTGDASTAAHRRILIVAYRMGLVNPSPPSG